MIKIMENRTKPWFYTYYSCEDIAFELTDQIIGGQIIEEDSREDVFGIIADALHHVEKRGQERTDMKFEIKLNVACFNDLKAGDAFMYAAEPGRIYVRTAAFLYLGNEYNSIELNRGAFHRAAHHNMVIPLTGTFVLKESNE